MLIAPVAATVAGRPPLPGETADLEPQRTFDRPPRVLLMVGAAAFFTLLSVDTRGAERGPLPNVLIPRPA